MAAADDLKTHLNNAMKDAMRARDTLALGAIRMAIAAVRKREIDGGTALDDAAVMAVLDKQVKQRLDSEQQFRAAGRIELADQEAREAEVLRRFLPEPLGPDAIDALITAACEAVGATGMRDMGKVMGALRPQLQGRADMQAVSNMVKQRLGS